MRESRWTQRLRSTYGVPEEVSAANVPLACAAKLASAAQGPGDSYDVTSALRGLAAEMLELARRLGDAGLLDDLFGSLRADGQTVNHEALVSSGLVLLHMDNEMKRRTLVMVRRMLADLKAGSADHE